MCKQCQLKRVGDVWPEAARIVYPKLRFVPDKYEKYTDYHNRPTAQLGEIKRLRSYNEDISRIEGEKYHFCKWCGSLHPHSYSYRHQGKFYCSRCWHNLFECNDCHTMAHLEMQQFRRSPDGMQPICYDCSTKLARCYSCTRFDDIKNITKLSVERDEIGNYVIYKLCGKCLDDGKRLCYRCGKMTHKTVSTKMKQFHYCPVCAEEMGGIQEYNYKPLLPRFQKHNLEGKVSKNAFYMGFELEMAPHNSFIPPEAMIHMLKEKVGRDQLYAMSDGSISQATNQDGMEIASHPFTWEYYKKQGYKKWDEMCLFLRQHGWKANTQGLGIHIHTTKAAWGTHQIYKLLKFVSNNRNYVQRIAQRSATHYNQYSALGPNHQKFIAKSKRNNDEGHYNAINLNNGDSGKSSKTIEFRIFQATLEPMYFHKNIEFVYACYLFTQQESRMTKWAFYEFVKNNRRMFPCLYEFMRSKLLCI
jgi:hypothetical protein